MIEKGGGQGSGLPPQRRHNTDGRAGVEWGDTQQPAQQAAKVLTGQCPDTAIAVKADGGGEWVGLPCARPCRLEVHSVGGKATCHMRVAVLSPLALRCDSGSRLAASVHRATMVGTDSRQLAAWLIATWLPGTSSNGCAPDGQGVVDQTACCLYSANSRVCQPSAACRCHGPVP
jgi:hypothetical protein